MSQIITEVLNWGRPKAKPRQNVTDHNGDFSPKETNELRRVLRDMYTSHQPGVCGDWRRGYEITIGGERVGVTNGYGPFKIYYRCNTPIQSEIPFDGEPVTPSEWPDDYGLPPVF